MDLPLPSFLSHSSLHTAKSVDFVVGTRWLPFVTEIVHNFHSDYFDCRGFFKELLIRAAIYNIATNEMSSFQIIIDKTGVRDVIF